MNRHAVFFISALVGILVAYVATMFSPKYLGLISQALCSQEFTLSGLACSYGGVAFTLALIPAMG